MEQFIFKHYAKYMLYEFSSLNFRSFGARHQALLAILGMHKSYS